MPYAAANFEDCATQTLGAVTATSTGTLLTASATANAKGAWATVGTAARPFETVHVFVGASSAAADYVIDIGISDGTNSFAIAEDLRLAARKAAGDMFLAYHLPIRIPEATVTARIASSTASATLRIVIVGSSSSLLSVGGFSKCEALYGPATSRGITIDPGATANTKGAWVQINAGLASYETMDALLIGIGPNADTARNAASTGLLDIGFGTAGNQYVAVGNILWGFTTTSDTPFPSVVGPIPVSVPTGTAIWARTQSTNSANGDRTIDLSLWGLRA
jgi:hypothetical protein